MDSIALVEEQIKGGQKLVERLNREDRSVLAAGWIKESEGGQWYLYLVTTLVSSDGATRQAYRHVTTVIRALQAEGVWIDPFEVKVVAPTDPIGEAIMEVQRQNPGRLPTRYGVSLIGFNIEGAYIYPPTPSSAV